MITNKPNCRVEPISKLTYHIILSVAKSINNPPRRYLSMFSSDSVCLEQLYRAGQLTDTD